MSDYSEKLKDPRWQKKRLSIFGRDGWTCQNCGATDQTLHVHHLTYIWGNEPWDYDEDHLITLCEECHRQEYEHYPKAEQEFMVQLRLWGLNSSSLYTLANAMKTCSVNTRRHRWGFVVFSSIIELFRDKNNHPAILERLPKIINKCGRENKDIFTIRSIRGLYADYLKAKRTKGSSK